MTINYPKEWIRRKGKRNTNGNFAWGEYNFNRITEKGMEQTSCGEYIRGYRKAISDVKFLNNN